MSLKDKRKADFEQLWFNARRIEVSNTDGGQSVQFTYGAGLDEVVLESYGSNRCPLQDGAGSVLAYVNQNGSITERYLYAPFGTVQVFDPSGANPRVDFNY